MRGQDSAKEYAKMDFGVKGNCSQLGVAVQHFERAEAEDFISLGPAGPIARNFNPTLF
jgi:hypothetical protein